MKRNQIYSLIFTIFALAFFILSGLAFFKIDYKEYGISLLCIASALLVLGSYFYIKSKRDKKNEKQ